MKIFAKDISEKKVFEAYGDTLKLKECVDPEKHIYIYERYCEGRLICYEVVKARKTKNPDGTIVYRYPQNEEWGTHGYTVFCNHKKTLKEAIENLMLLGCVENMP